VDNGGRPFPLLHLRELVSGEFVRTEPPNKALQPFAAELGR
jgi:hypothetical protein